MKYLCDQLQRVGLRVISRLPKDKDMIVNIPPGTSKSTIASIMFPVWLWVRDPTLTVITASYGASLSLSLSTKSRDILVSEKFKRFFPKVVIKEDRGAKSDYATTENGARISTSTGSGITGRHANIIIVDDPQNPKLVNSEKERAKTLSFVTTTLSTRKVDKNNTPMIIVQQRLHPADVTGGILAKGKPIEHICLPAELTEKCTAPEIYVDGLLDPKRLGRETLATIKIDSGSSAYNAEQNQNPEGDKNSKVKEAWLPIMSKDKFAELVKDKKYKVDFYLDTAYTEDSENDPSAILACTKIDNFLYILGCAEWRLEFPELIKEIETWTKANGYTGQSIIKVEPKASGKSVVQTLKKTSLNIIEDVNPTKSKIERLIAIAPKCEALKVVLIEGTWNSLLIGQVTQNFPPHDDVRDTFCSAVRDKLIENNNSGTYASRMGFAK